MVWAASFFCSSSMSGLRWRSLGGWGHEVYNSPLKLPHLFCDVCQGEEDPFPTPTLWSDESGITGVDTYRVFNPLSAFLLGVCIVPHSLWHIGFSFSQFILE